MRSPSMRAAVRASAPALTLAAVGLAAACADGPTGPGRPAPAQGLTQAFVAGPHLSAAPATTVVPTLKATATLSQDAAVSFTVQPGGSTFTLGGGAAVVKFPAGFVAAPTTFTITRKAGPVVGYDFQPSGTFSKPVTVTIKLAGTAWSSTTPLQGAYVRDWAQVDAANGTATVDELVPTTVDARAGTATLTLSHFSGYLMSTGKTTTTKR